MKGDVIVNVFIVVALALGMCSRQAKPENVSSSGYVKFVQIEGGFYGIVTSTGEQLEPVNLPAEFCVNGLKVYVEYEPAENASSIYQWGKIIKILSIRIE